MNFAYSLPIFDDTGILEEEKITVESVRIKIIDDFKSLGEIQIGDAINDIKVPDRLKNQMVITVPQKEGGELKFRKLYCTRVPNEKAKEGDLIVVWIRERHY